MIWVTQRVDVTSRNERRDALDQRWVKFLNQCELLPLLVPNNVRYLDRYLTFQAQGILMTGGNDLAKYGGDAPERDQLEAQMLSRAVLHQIPVLGICRGMQVIQDYFQVGLNKVNGHVSEKQKIQVMGVQREVNSYHRWGTSETVSQLEVTGRSEDGIVKAIQHKTFPIVGQMWHPERFTEFKPEDLDFFKNFFGSARC